MPATLILTALSFTAAEIATMYVARFVINFAVSYLVTRLFSNGANTQTDNGVRQQVPPGTNNSIPIVYGDAYLGGTFVDAVLTTDQKTMYYVVAISSISPNGQFTFDQTKMYWADQLITFDGTDLTKVVSLTDGAGNPNAKVNGNIYINLYTSTAAGTITSANGAAAPSSVMGGADIAVAQRWTGTRQMNGLAFAIIKLIYSQDAGTTQMQAITFHVSHYLNGAGAAVPGDVWYDYMTSEIYGAGMAAGLVNSASRTALNTYSNATITFTNSSGNPDSQARYRINGVLDTGQNVLSNIDRILIACDSWNQYNAATGQWTAVINKATSTTFTFDDTNIIGEIKVSALDITSSINQVEASFPSKLNRDQTDVVFIETPSGLLYPNEPINKYSVSIDLSNDSVQTSYLANRLLEQAREDLIVTINAAYPAIQVDAGDVVSVTNTAYGWSAKLFRVMKITEVSMPDGNLGASLDLTEYNAAVYDDQDITQFSATPNSGLPSPGYFSALAAPTISASRPAATVPSFDVQVVTPMTGRVTSINLYYTTSASPGVTDWIPLAIYTTTNSQPIAQATTYQFDNIILPAGTYYYSAIVSNDVSSSALSSVSTATVWAPTGTTGANGTRTATLIVYQWAASAPISFPSGVSTYTWVSASWTGGTLGSWTTTPTSSVAGQTLWMAEQLYADTDTSATSSVTWSTSTAVAVGGAGTNGDNGARTAILEVYKWASSTPTTFPSGTSTYTWASGVFTAPATLNGWELSPASSVAGQTLWGCTQIYSDTLTNATSTVTWGTSTAFAVGGAGTNGNDGDPGAKSITICAYKWATSAPSVPTQAFTYTWASGDVSAYPSGWTSASASSPGSGYTLYQINLIITDVVTDATTATNWSASTLNTIGYTETGSIGPQGDSSRIAYCKSTIAAPSGTTTSTGSASLPATGSFSLTGAVFATSPPALVTGEYLYQTDGIYVVSTNTISWATPYLSNLKVGSLSAISADLGTITAGSISGASLTVGTSPAVSGTTMTGAGAVVNTTGTFALGNSTTNISYNGTQMTLNGNVVATANINANAVTLTGSAFTSATYLNTTAETWEDAQTLTISASGAPLYISAAGVGVDGVATSGEMTYTFPPQFRLTRGAVVLMNGNFSMAYGDTPSAGSHTYKLQVLSSNTTPGTITTLAGISNRSLFVLETKR